MFKKKTEQKAVPNDTEEKEIPAKGTENNKRDSKDQGEFYAAIKEKIAEMMRRAALSDEERAAEDELRERTSFEEEKRAYGRERQEFTAAKLLFEAGLPEKLSGLAAGENDEETRERVEILRELFSEELEKAVGEHLKGKTPPIPPQKSTDDPFLSGLRL